MIVKSQAANVDPPIVSLPEYLLQHTESHGDRIALIDGPSGRSYTYRQFTAHVRSFAANLCARGFQKGDSFAIYSPNQPEYAIAFIGIALAWGYCYNSQSALHRRRANPPTRRCIRKLSPLTM